MMRKIYCNISECKYGDILADDIYNKYGTLVIPKNLIINEYTKQKLIDLGVCRISIFEPVSKTAIKVEASFLEFSKDYRKNAETVKEVLNELARGKNLDYDKVNSISDSIYGQANSNYNIIECISKIRNVDEYTYTHSINVSIYAMLIGKWLNLSEKNIKDLVEAGILHDIGKSKIPIEILNKKGPLLTEEFDIMKKHTTYGYNICKGLSEINNEVMKAILMHHEKENGSGYPFGVKGDKISLYSKIISLADVYDALTSERIYKKRMTPFETFKELEKIGLGTGNFDTKILLTFLSNISIYYTGARVKMNNGELGEIVYIPPQHISFPVIKINNEFIDLFSKSDLKIIEML